MAILEGGYTASTEVLIEFIEERDTVWDCQEQQAVSFVAVCITWFTVLLPNRSDSKRVMWEAKVSPLLFFNDSTSHFIRCWNHCTQYSKSLYNGTKEQGSKEWKKYVIYVPWISKLNQVISELGFIYIMLCFWKLRNHQSISATPGSGKHNISSAKMYTSA